MGGTHVSGFERPDQKRSTSSCGGQGAGGASRTDKVDKDDITAGLTAVVTVRLAEPQFEGQTKEVLGTPQVTGIVRGWWPRPRQPGSRNHQAGEKAQLLKEDRQEMECGGCRLPALTGAG